MSTTITTIADTLWASETTQTTLDIAHFLHFQTTPSVFFPVSFKGAPYEYLQNYYVIFFEIHHNIHFKCDAFTVFLTFKHRNIFCRKADVLKKSFQEQDGEGQAGEQLQVIPSFLEMAFKRH